MIVFEKINKSFVGNFNVLENLSFEIFKGEILVLLGSSGSGKSTTLKMINRLVEPTSGNIYLEGNNILDAELVYSGFPGGLVGYWSFDDPNDLELDNPKTLPKEIFYWFNYNLFSGQTDRPVPTYTIGMRT